MIEKNEGIGNYHSDVYPYKVNLESMTRCKCSSCSRPRLTHPPYHFLSRWSSDIIPIACLNCMHVDEKKYKKALKRYNIIQKIRWDV